MIYRKILLTVMLMMLFNGCGSRNLRYFPRMHAHHTAVEQQENVVVAVQNLSTEQQHNYFGLNFLEPGYSVLLLRIENRSPSRCVVRPSYCDIPRESGYAVAPHMHYDTYARVVWSSIPALIFWWPAIPLFVIPHALYWSNYNWVTSHNLAKKTWEQEETLSIEPYETIQKFVFIPNESFVPRFTLALFNEDTQQLMTYVLDLRV